MAQNTTAAAVVASPTTMEAIDAVVKPLVDSAIGAGEKAGMGLAEGALGVVGFIFASSQKTAGPKDDEIYPGHGAPKDDAPEAKAAAGGRGVRGGKKDRSQQGIDDQVRDITKNQQNLRKVGQGNAINSTNKSDQAQKYKNSRIRSSEDVEQQ